MRLFVAIKFDEPTEQMLKHHVRELKRCSDGGVFTRDENLHLTLAFIGESDRPYRALECIKKCKFEPFDITLGSWGHFKDLYYISVLSESLKPLAEQVRKELIDGGFDIDTKKFVPHITLGRQCKLVCEPVMPLSLVSCRINKICLMRSDRIKGKLVYTEIKDVRK